MVCPSNSFRSNRAAMSQQAEFLSSNVKVDGRHEGSIPLYVRQVATK
jgi:hypothetical protein